MSGISSFKILLTTLKRPDVYGAQLDITQDVDVQDFIFKNGIGKMKLKSDDSDYDIGLFNFSNITVKASNVSGKFNPAGDWRSLFIFTRDKAKMDIIYTDQDGVENTIFKGLVNEEATRQDFIKEEVRFKILSQDSIFRKVAVTGGTIQNNTLFSDAIKAILSKPAITSVLNFDEVKINVQFDDVIDDGEFFTNRTTKFTLDQLLVASNSVLVIDDTNTMVIRDRRVNANIPHLLANGGTAFTEQENIINLRQYNTGLHRAFNSFVVNGEVATDDDFIEEFGLRQKEITLDFITNAATADNIAANLVENFSAPKVEMEITTDFEIAKDFKLYDAVSVDFNTRNKRFKNNRMPLYNIARYDEDVYPYTVGSFEIEPNQTFKIIGLSYNAKDYTIALKLREIGIGIGDSIGTRDRRITDAGDPRITDAGNQRIV